MAISAKAAQDFVPIKEIRDGIVVLKNDGLRAVILASSVNLSLKSDEEQQATIAGFQTFLNSLDFPTQIVIQSRRMDIRPYLLLLEGRMKMQTEPLLKVQTREYIDFIRKYTETHNIMTKNFFVIVPYTSTKISGPSSGGFGFFSKKSAQEKETEIFEEKRSQLDQRVEVIQQGLSRVGIKSVQLDTPAVVELFYKVFNPGETESAIKLES